MNMRERIARVIHPSSFGPSLHESFTPQFIAEMQEHTLAKADAVLAAMREPTDAMLDAAGIWIDEEVDNIERGWQAMIDACDSGGRSESRDADAARAVARQSGDAESGASPNTYPKDGGGGVG